jgi:hypothetical protein
MKKLKLYLLMFAAFTASSALAQTMPVQPLTPMIPETAPDTSVEPPLVAVPRTMMCGSATYVREMLDAQGLVLWAAGKKSPDYIPGDPFGSIIIVRHPQTLAYVVVLFQPENNIACVVAMGNYILTEQEQLDLQR